MTTTTILPCPYCEHRAEVDNWQGYRPLVRCGDAACNARGPECDFTDEAIIAWNRVAWLGTEIARAVVEERNSCAVTAYNYLKANPDATPTAICAIIRARGAKEKA